MIYLALDASTHSTGVAIFDDDKLIGYECITASSTDLIKRIHKMTDRILEIIKEYNIQTIILEEVRPENGLQNIKTQKALMFLQAAINFTVHDNTPKVTIEYVYPSEWRKQCGIHTGRGIKRESLKQADMDFVKENYKIDVNDDIADAICIGHAYVNNLENAMNWD